MKVELVQSINFSKFFWDAVKRKNKENYENGFFGIMRNLIHDF